jgi:cytochrome oxidase Cu insertion factor (SCO1/SenC/PrrC family)
LDVKIKRIGNTFGTVCEECAKAFSDEEIELMHNMFTAFGGYYGKMSNSKELSYSKLEEIAKDYKEQYRDINEVENDVKTLHSAFLYGISPQQLVKGLKLLID